MDRQKMDRRTFVTTAMAAAGGARFPGIGSASDPSPPSPEIDAFIRERMATYHIAGVAACLVKNDRMVWSNTYGFADLERQIPMSLDWVQNICSISKTFTTTALMQLWEQGRFRLDDDVSDYLSFPVRNPAHPAIPITFRLLLTHQSSIRDGEWYGRMYQCGDPEVSLADWIEGYLRPGGRFYDAQENFQVWAPGDRWDYNNVAFGLVGYLVERISGEPFIDYSRTHVFRPLEMNETSWYLADIDVSRHVVPYTYVEGGEVRSPTWGGRPLGVILEGSGSTVPQGDGHHAKLPLQPSQLPRRLPEDQRAPTLLVRPSLPERRRSRRTPHTGGEHHPGDAPSPGRRSVADSGPHLVRRTRNPWPRGLGTRGERPGHQHGHPLGPRRTDRGHRVHQHLGG